MILISTSEGHTIVPFSVISFTGSHCTPITSNQATLWQLSTSAQAWKGSASVAKADMLEINFTNDKLNPKGLSKTSDTSD